jgi:hypothetical protein
MCYSPTTMAQREFESFAEFIQQNEAFTAVQIEELKKLFEQKVKDGSEYINQMRELLARMAPKPPYRYFSPAFKIQGMMGYISHGAEYDSLAESLQQLTANSQGYVVADNHIIASCPDTLIPMGVNFTRSSINDAPDAELPAYDERIQLYIAAKNLIDNACKTPPTSTEILQFLLVEATGERVMILNE